jgi:ribonuclease R
MSKRLRNKKRERFLRKIIKILSKCQHQYKQIGAKLEVDDTESRNQIIKI